jgi:hypothetical protein
MKGSAIPTNDRQAPQGRRNPNYRRGTFPGAEQQAASINHPGPVTE